MQYLSRPSCEFPLFPEDRTPGCQTLVRFFGSFRIEPHVPLVVCLPANSFEFQPCGRPPQAACLTGYLRHTSRLNRDMQLASIRLGLGLRRSLICFAPLAFVSQRQLSSSKPPSPLVFPRVSTHFTTPPSVPLTLKKTLSHKYFCHFQG